MLGGALEVVHHDPVPRLDEEHAAPVHHRIGEPEVGIVGRVGKVHRRVRPPAAQAGLGPLPPLEWSRRRRLLDAVHHDGAVRRGAAEEIAPDRFDRIAVRPRVDEVRQAEHGTLDAEEIGMGVARAHRRAERPDVEDQLMRVPLPPALHHRIPAVGEQARRRGPGGRGRERLVRGRPRSAQQPERLRRRPAGDPRVVGSAEEGRRDRKDPPQIAGGPRDERQEPSAVIIADERHRAVRPAKGRERIEQPLQARGHGIRNGDPVSRRQDQEVEIDLSGVPLIVRGLLEVDTIRKDLTLALLEEDPRPARLPPPAAGEVGEQGSRVHEAQRLARQVGVGREVGREIPLDVAGMRPDGGEQEGAQLGGDRPRAFEQHQRPAPGDQPEGRLQAARPVDADPRGICPQPCPHIPGEGLRVPLVPRQPVGLTEVEPPLVAAQLPNDLAVSDRSRIERIEPAPVHERRAPARDRIQVPVHGIAEVEPAVPQQIEAPPADLVGGGDDRFARARDPLDLPDRVGGARGALEKAQGHPLAEGVEERGGHGPAAVRRNKPVEPFRRLLPAAHGDLGGRHLQQALQPHTAGARVPGSVPAACGAPPRPE